MNAEARDSEWLTRVICDMTGLPLGIPLVHLLSAARRERLIITLLSAMKADGNDIGGLVDEVDAVERRLEGYARIREVALEMDARTIQIKGAGIGGFYPAGWVRYSNDLDLVVRNESARWGLAEYLLSCGFSLHSVNFVVLGEVYHPYLVMKRPTPDPLYCSMEKVELLPFHFIGDTVSLRPVVSLSASPDLSPAALQLLAVLEEFYQHPFDGRLILDAWLLIDAMDLSECGALWDAIDETGAWLEWWRLVATLEKSASELNDLPIPPHFRRRVGLTLARRARHVASHGPSLPWAFLAVAQLLRCGRMARVTRTPRGTRRSRRAKDGSMAIWAGALVSEERSAGLVVRPDGRGGARAETPLGVFRLDG